MNWIQNWTLSISLTFWRFPHHSMHTHTHAYDIIWRIVAHQLCKNLFLSRLHHAALHYIIQCDFKSMHIDLFSFFFLNFEFHQVNFFGGFLVFDMMKFSLRLFFRFEFHVMKILILICHSLKMKKKNRLKMCGDAHTFQSIWFFDGEFQQNKINK